MTEHRDRAARPLNDARRSLASLLDVLPEERWREHKGAFENAVEALVEENAACRAERDAYKERLDVLVRPLWPETAGIAALRTGLEAAKKIAREAHAERDAARAENQRLNALAHKLMNHVGDKKLALLDSVYEAGYQAGYEQRNQDDPLGEVLDAARAVVEAARVFVGALRRYETDPTIRNQERHAEAERGLVGAVEAHGAATGEESA